MAIEPEREEQNVEAAMKLHPRQLSEEQWRTFEGYMAELSQEIMRWPGSE